MYSRNITSFLEHIVRGGELALDMTDVIVEACCVTRSGEIRHGLGTATKALTHA